MNKNTTIILPTITNLQEASKLNLLFPAVITAGPEQREVEWGHHNHLVRTFDDVMDGRDAPTASDVEAMLQFALQNNGEILIHCHAGMSRSTATAWGVAILRGEDPAVAYDALKNGHPEGRMFWPNDLIVAHLESIFDIDGLTEYNQHHHFSGDWWYN